MKLHGNNDTTETNVENFGNFKIDVNEKAYKVLSSNLYSDKILAIVRELSCNALDAHRQAKNLKTPFVIELPSLLENNNIFSIRDYGTGLSHNNVVELYTTFFRSTKNDSNEFIGGLGLGSKTPFSYTDSFTVESFYNGVKLMYACVLKDGMPSISKVGETPTKEKNGLKISIPTKDDYSVWTEKIKKVYTYFEHIPEIKNFDEQISHYSEKQEFLKLSDEFYVDAKEKLYGSINLKAIMGDVAYPVNMDIVYDSTEFKSEDEESQKAIRTLLDVFSNEVIMVFDIGKLDVAPSREELSYDEETIKNIVKKLKKLDIELNNYILKEVDGLSDYEKYLKLDDNHILRSSQKQKDWYNTFEEIGIFEKNKKDGSIIEYSIPWYMYQPAKKNVIKKRSTPLFGDSIKVENLKYTCFVKISDDEKTSRREILKFRKFYAKSGYRIRNGANYVNSILFIKEKERKALEKRIPGFKVEFYKIDEVAYSQLFSTKGKSSRETDAWRHYSIRNIDSFIKEDFDVDKLDKKMPLLILSKNHKDCLWGFNSYSYVFSSNLEYIYATLRKLGYTKVCIIDKEHELNRKRFQKISKYFLSIDDVFNQLGDVYKKEIEVKNKQKKYSIDLLSSKQQCILRMAYEIIENKKTDLLPIIKNENFKKSIKELHKIQKQIFSESISINDDDKIDNIVIADLAKHGVIVRESGDDHLENLLEKLKSKYSLIDFVCDKFDISYGGDLRYEKELKENKTLIHFIKMYVNKF